MNLYNDLVGPVLKHDMDYRDGIMIERLLMLAQFTKDLILRGNEAP